MKIRTGFRGRLVAGASIVSLVTLGAAFGAISFLVNRSQQRQLDDALAAVATEEATDLARAPGALRISDRPGPAANDVGPLPKLGVIYGPAGDVINATPNVRGRPPNASQLGSRESGCFDMWFEGDHLRAVVMPIPGRIGTRLLMAAPRDDLDGDAAFLRRAMLAVFIFAGAWTVALAIGIVGRLTRHHRAIAETAQRVAQGDLSARVGAVGTRDEVAELGRNIDEMIERLAMLLKGQEQFIAHAAHELRSPLASLYGELVHALRRSRDANEYRAAIEEALDSTRRLKTLAEDLLSLARLGTERRTSVDSAELDHVLREAIAAIADERTAHDVAVQVSCPLGIVVRGPSADLSRMFRNLLENAVRHAPSGSVVRALVLHSPTAINVEIRDEGPGVPPGDRNRVFDPFFRGAQARASNHPGAGLGLTIARDIARLHGGDILLEANPRGAGARFDVLLAAAHGLAASDIAPSRLTTGDVSDGPPP